MNVQVLRVATVVPATSRALHAPTVPTFQSTSFNVRVLLGGKVSGVKTISMNVRALHARTMGHVLTLRLIIVMSQRVFVLDRAGRCAKTLCALRKDRAFQ